MERNRTNDGTTNNHRPWLRRASPIALCALALLISGAPARALVTMTMDDLPFQQLDGLSHLGVNFGFTVAGIPSTDANYASGGPGTTTHTSDPAIEGNTSGVVQIDFDQPTDTLEVGFALNTFAGEIGAVSVELFDQFLTSLGVFSVDTSLGSFTFPSGQFVNSSNLCVSRAIVSFSSVAGRFVMDDMTYEEAIPCSCPTAPTTCVTGFTKGQLLVNEKVAGKEKLTAKLLKGPLLVQSDFGDPVAGSTVFNLCIYDDTGALAADLEVDRAGDSCGTKDCWKALGGAPPNGKGFKYKDKATASDGVLLINTKAGSPGKSKALVKAKNSTGAMPTGIAANLNGSLSATVQLLTSDSQCVSVTLSNIVKDDGTFFKAK